MTNVSAPPNAREAQRQEQKAATRERVFQAALEVFRRHGFEEASIDLVTRRAGVSRGTFYFHFPKREDVMVELLRRAELPVAAVVDALPEATRLDELLGAI